MQIELSDLFKSMVWDILLKKAISKMMVSLVISPTGFLGVLLTKIIIAIADRLYPIIIEFVKIESIILTDEVHQKGFERAQLKLKVIALEKGINSQEFKDARKKEQDALLKLIKFNDGSTVVRVG